MNASEWDDKVAECALPPRFVEEVGIPKVGQWVPYLGYRIRSRQMRHDKAAVLLAEKGAMTSREIAALTGVRSWRSLDNLLSRSPFFVRLAKGGWNLAEAVDGPVYTSTLPAVLDTLRERGPLTKPELVKEVQSVHPVTPWRIEQCLDNFQIGVLPDGRVWLVEQGASRPAEEEPPCPDSMVSMEDVVGIRFTVSFDHVRGSGTPFSNWLCWKLGLRASPEAAYFAPSDATFEETISVTRQGGPAGLGSIRTIIEKMGVAVGCELVLILRLGSRTWSMKHVCPTGRCGAATS
jgi:hypothetical protein